MTDELPRYVTRLYEHQDEAINFLLPDHYTEANLVLDGPIKLNTNNCFWTDEQTGECGELVDLWSYKRGKEKGQETEKDICLWLLNRKSPPNMMRFVFTPEELDKPDFLLGDRIEVMPDVWLYPATTTLLAGYNGTGKSTLATQICHIAALHGIKSFILSPEMPPQVTSNILHRQATSVDQPSPSEWQRVSRYVAGHFMISTLEDRITPQAALKQFDDAYDAGCRLMVLDSLTCVRAGHELHQQANFADDLRNWSRKHPDAYLLVIAHMRKPANGQSGLMSRYDIRGAGEISDLAGHIWLVQRKNPFSNKELNQYGDYDSRLIVDKNRATGKLTCKMLRFSPIQKLFHPTKQPPCYVDFDGQKESGVARIY